MPWGKRYALLVVLGYSRLLWVQFYPRQTLATIITGLEAAFAYFGGVPHELLFDQLKAVVVDDERAEGGKLLENPEFLRFARHWSFRIRACRPYRAKTKGKVERPVRYLRTNFVYGREFVGDADLNAEALRWLDTTANQRLHRTLTAVPRERFEADERRCYSRWPCAAIGHWCCRRSGRHGARHCTPSCRRSPGSSSSSGRSASISRSLPSRRRWRDAPSHDAIPA